MNDIEKPDRVAAHRRAETIRSGIEGFASSKTAIADAFDARDWITLGYTSWGEYCKKEIGNKLKLPRAERDLAIEAFHELGMSVREIADALEVAKSTVQDALKPPPPKASGSGHPDASAVDPLSLISDEAKAAIAAKTSVPAATSPAGGSGETDPGQSAPADSGAAGSAAGSGASADRPEPAAPEDHPIPGDEDGSPEPSDAQPPVAEEALQAGDETGSGRSFPGPGPVDGRERQGGSGASPSAAPDPDAFDRFLDEQVPNADPHQKWRAAFLRAIRQSHALAAFSVDDIVANGNDMCFDALVNLKDFVDGYLLAVQKERVELQKRQAADLPANVTPIRRTA